MLFSAFAMRIVRGIWDQPRRIVAVIRRLSERLDTPWLLPPVVPLLALVPRVLPAGAILPVNFLVVLAVWAASRRWALDAVRPTLVICLFYLVRVPALPDLGDIWMIPVLLAACRLGLDSRLIDDLSQRQRIGAADGFLLLAFLISAWDLHAFDPEFALGGRPGSFAALLLFGLLGTSRVSFWKLLPLVVIATAAKWGLAPLQDGLRLRDILSYDFGLLPIDAIACCLAFAAGRILARPRERPLWLAVIAVALWLAMLAVATHSVSVQLFYGPFGQTVRSLLFGMVGDPRLGSTRQELVPWTLVVAQAVIAWQLTAAHSARMSNRWKVSVAVAIALLVPVAVVAMIAAGYRLSLGEASLSRQIIVATPGAVTDAFGLAIRCASLLLLSTLAVAVTRRVFRTPPAPDARQATSFVVATFGWTWSLLAPVQFLCLCAIALGLALGNPGQAIVDVRQSVAAMDGSPGDNVADNADAMADAFEAAADNATAADTTDPIVETNAF
jgi:hypothetical protein